MNLRLQGERLEKEMATHSNVLAWRAPGTAEPGGLPLWGRAESDTSEATRQRQGEGWGRGKEGVWDGHAHVAVFRMDNHAGPPAERREPAQYM